MTDLGSCAICGGNLHEAVAAPDRLHGTSGCHTVAACDNCGAGFTQPHVRDSDLVAFYPDEYGPYGDKMGPLARRVSRLIRAFQGRHALRSEPLHALSASPPGLGLDVGCGRGDLAAMLVARGWSMIGIDPSAAACASASARGVQTLQGTLATVDLPTDQFDAVLFHHSLEHVSDPGSAVRQAISTTRPGGIVMISVPNFGGWQARSFGGRWYHLDLPRHRVHFTHEALERVLHDAGYEICSITTSSTAVGLPASVGYTVAGKCLWPGGLGLRIASGLATATLPITWTIDRIAGREGDVLHAVGRRPT